MLFLLGFLESREINAFAKIYEPQIYFVCAVFRGSKRTNQDATVASQKICKLPLFSVFS